MRDMCICAFVLGVGIGTLASCNGRSGSTASIHPEPVRTYQRHTSPTHTSHADFDADDAVKFDMCRLYLAKAMTNLRTARAAFDDDAIRILLPEERTICLGLIDQMEHEAEVIDGQLRRLRNGDKSVIPAMEARLATLQGLQGRFEDASRLLVERGRRLIEHASVQADLW